MRRNRTHIACLEYVEWYNSRAWHNSNRMRKKKEVAEKYRISVRTLERAINDLYRLDKSKYTSCYVIKEVIYIMENATNDTC